MFSKLFKTLLLYFVLPFGIVAAYVFDQYGANAGEVVLQILMGIFVCVVVFVVISIPFNSSARPTRGDIHGLSDRLDKIADLLKEENKR